MRIIYFNADGEQVHIGISGDHHLTGNRLCCGCSVAKSNLGWGKLMWAQGAQVKTQENPILSAVQMRDNGCVVNYVALAHGGKQEILSPTGLSSSRMNYHIWCTSILLKSKWIRLLEKNS